MSGEPVHGEYQFLKIEHASATYWHAVALREEVLRVPLKMIFTQEELLAETAPQRHYGLCTGDDPACMVAGVCALPLSDGVWKIRQVAVAQHLQGTGLGRRLMEAVERDLSENMGARHFVLHSRVKVQAFYEKLGYAPVGPGFDEVGIPHQRMEKAAPLTAYAEA